jgi:hypothetical protein
MKRHSQINFELKKADIALRNYVLELEKENSRLQKIIAKLQVQNTSYQYEISALKKLANKPRFIIKTSIPRSSNTV